MTNWRPFGDKLEKAKSGVTFGMKMCIGHSSSHQPNGPAPDRTNKISEENNTTDVPIPKYIPTTPRYIPFTPVPCLREMKAKRYPFHIKNCEIALQSYNKKHRSSYKLIDLVESNVIIFKGYWIHYNFTANGEDSVPLVFFAEMEVIYQPEADVDEDDKKVTSCVILDGFNIVRGCYHCQTSGDILDYLDHPTRGFRTRIPGVCDVQRVRSLRPRPFIQNSRIC